MSDSETRGTYLMALSVPAYRLDERRFAVESAFAEHLRALRTRFADVCSSLVLAGPEMTPDEYERVKPLLGVVDETTEAISFRPMFPYSVDKVGFFRRYPEILRRVGEEVARATIVHSRCSTLHRPWEFPLLVMAAAKRKTTICVTDIDHRQSAYMNYKTGRWSFRQFASNELIHLKAAHLQQLVAARICSLYLLKGDQLARDYGYGVLPNVKSFLDAAFDAHQVVSNERLEAKLARVRDHSSPLQLGYFGRLVEYKGVDHMLRAIRTAIDHGARSLHFHIIGDGDQRASLEALTDSLGLADVVTFHGAMPFDASFFERLQHLDVLLGAPLTEDTPRSVLDAMASGQIVVAYDTYYYRELAATSGAVVTVPWLDVEALGRTIAALTLDRRRLAESMARAVSFARENTQSIWLERREAWTRDVLRKAASTPA